MSELVELITKWETFKQTFKEGTVTEFGEWIQADKKFKSQMVEPASFSASAPEFDNLTEEQAMVMKAGYLIGKLYQYITIYSKPLVKKYNLHSMDDFGYLATVEWHTTISKSKACAAMLQEVTTGSDIIKRLLGLGYLKETPDKTDRRQKFLQLTAKGKKVLLSLKSDFQFLPDVLGELERENREKFVGWMMELDRYHEKIVKDMRSS